jgi:thiamine biosynthesis lipoprotein ApbE
MWRAWGDGFDDGQAREPERSADERARRRGAAGHRDLRLIARGGWLRSRPT